jgi:GT2 family glycosyltransferase
LISVIIPSYRRPDLLARLLDSVCAQTTLPDEVIVVDDASGMDEAYQLCIQQYQNRLPSLLYHKLEQNSGAPHARNIGILRARHEWIALVDDDDEWLPEKLTKQRHIAETCHPSVGLIYTWTQAQGNAEQPSYQSTHSIEGDARRAILSSNFIMSPSVMVRRQAIKAAGLFDKALPSCQDWDMWARIFLKGYTCAVVPEILAIYHRHGGESIGLSARAKLGYKLFLDKHFLAILRHTSLINILKKSWLYIQVWRATRARA